MDANVDFSHTSTRAEQNARGCIRTYTNRLVNPWAMNEKDISIDDISYHTSHETRYAGAVGFYSVGQHSLEVVREAQMAGETSPRFLLGCLLHDAEEAYFKDMPSPIKAHPHMEGYRFAAYVLRCQIFKLHGLNWDEMADRIKAFDHETYYRERRSFDKRLTVDDYPIVPWPAGASHLPFMDTYRRLMYRITP